VLLGADAHLAAFDGQYGDLDAFTGWCFDDDGFAGASCEYEQCGLLAGNIFTLFSHEIV